jgi:erythromycin esterase
VNRPPTRSRDRASASASVPASASERVARARAAVEDQAIADIHSLARPLAAPADLDPLLDRVGSARIVLLGEASHGTADYYEWRDILTRRLIAERGFSFVAVEGDWPDCFRLNGWVKDSPGGGRTVVDVLEEYARWPRWMWANEEVAAFADWLRDHNRGSGRGVGFYGLDVFSLWESMSLVTDYLAAEHPDELAAAEAADSCFAPFSGSPDLYARAARPTRQEPASCEMEVAHLLSVVRRQVRRTRRDYPAGRPASGPEPGPESSLDIRQNAEVMAGAERYYRAVGASDAQSWNIRDHHMADTLDRLLAHHGPRSKAVVWEHNTHVGDARATTMAAHGMVNVGQLVRERHGPDDVVIVGFAGHHGTVIAAKAWGTAAECLPMPAAPDGSHEQLLHQALREPSLLVFPRHRDSGWLAQRRDHRAIGVVYHPEADRYTNWVPTVMGRRYDALCSFDAVEALHPLRTEFAGLVGGEQETWPSGG